MRAYRYILDFLEEFTTAFATVTLVNSKYTQGIFKQNFPLIQRYCNQRTPDILYPALDCSHFELL